MITVGVMSAFVLLFLSISCGHTRPTSVVARTTLRIGVGGLPLLAPQAGLRQLISALTLETLVAPNDNGRLRPWLAESWAFAQDGLLLDVEIHKGATFHDGTPVTSDLVVQSLLKDLPEPMGPAFNDIQSIQPVTPSRFRITLTRPSQFILDALETAIQKPDKPGVGTGPYMKDPSKTGELLANTAYYLGRPEIDGVTVSTYPSVRTAWAELLRGNLDMLHEVNIDALDSLQASTSVAVFSYLRHYQYMIVFGSHAAGLMSAAVRRELNAAIDRDAIVREALNGHGRPSIGPIPPDHWALDPAAPTVKFDRALARSLSSRHLRFTCLVPADSVYERVALAVRQQLAGASVDMDVQEATQEEILRLTRDNNYDAVLLDLTSGPTVFRSYRAFHSKVTFVPKPRSSELVDLALERIQHASTDMAYRSGVTSFQQAIVNDPPALFLVWGERARAVSRNFEVTARERNQDILNTLRFWRPAGPQQVTPAN